MTKNVKITTRFNLLDLIAPLKCRGCNQLGNPLCERCKIYNINRRQNLCPNCYAPNQTGLCKNCHNQIPVFIFDKKENLIGTLIHDYKYNSVRALSRPLAELFNAILPDLPKNTVIVPLPTSTRHIRERGFDHILLIANKLAKLRQIQAEKLLVRAKNTVQVGTDAKTRVKQAQNAYDISPRIKIDPNKTYLLLDDVWTTGATMNAAVLKLKHAGAMKIMVATLALTAGQTKQKTVPAPNETPKVSMSTVEPVD